MINKKYRQGVGALILNNENKIFVAKRITPKNSWQMPQGGIDDYEDPDIALFRELKEEIGTDNVKIIGKTQKLKYDLPDADKKNLFNGKYNGQEQVWYIVKFLGNDADIDLNYHHAPEFLEWKWENEDYILSNIVSFKYNMYAEVISYMKKILNNSKFST